MSRYATMFERLDGPSTSSGQGEGAFGAFLMLGDPDIETSKRLLDQHQLDQHQRDGGDAS